MDSIFIENFRCFGKGREVPLAPITLLVGENSTGKTSFMAMVQALGNMMGRRRNQDFNDPPYDLGNFNEIIYHHVNEQPSKISAGFSITQEHSKNIVNFRVDFKEMYGMPTPVEVSLSDGKSWCRIRSPKQKWDIQIGTENGTWSMHSNPRSIQFLDKDGYFIPNPLQMLSQVRFMINRRTMEDWDVKKGCDTPSDEDMKKVNELLTSLIRPFHPTHGDFFSTAPIRSKPLRVYSPSSTAKDPEGNNMPSYLEGIYFRDREKWESIKDILESYGRRAGLFNEISINPLGKEQGVPFQIRVRKHSKKTKGPWRNLPDVGYGISQVLPIIVEMSELRRGTYLLQQPEVHLHPRAQAALGTLFSSVASKGEVQLIVETHSDYLLNRIRTEARDKESEINPEDVLILFFEQSDKDIDIHPLKIDAEGNVLNTPRSYRKFFMEEIQKTLGL